MPNAVLQYDFAVVGAKVVDRAFASVEKRAVRHNVKMAQAFGRPGSSGSRPVKRIDSAARAAAMINRKVAADAAQAAKAKEAQLKKYGQIQSRQHKADLAFIRKKKAEATRASASVARAEMAAHKRSKAAASRAMEAAHRERRRASGALLGNASRSVRGTTRAVGGAAVGALGIGGSLLMGSAIGQQTRETAMASTLANQAGTPGAKRQLLQESQSIRGFTGEEALGALTSFVDLTGDLKTARSLLRDMAELSLATGASFEDVASASGNFANNLEGVKDHAERAKLTMSAMRSLAGQGQAGAIELKDLAGGGAALGAVASQYSGDKVDNIKKAGVLAQAARKTGGATSADEALTALGRFTDQVAAKSKELEAMGVNVGTRDNDGNITRLADPRTLIADVLDATKGDLATVSKVFGIRGKKVVQGFSDSYQSEGRQGVLRQFDGLMKTELTKGEIKSRSASRLADPDLQFKEVMRDFNAQLGTELLPVLTLLIPEFAKLLPSVTTAARVFGALVESLADNPIMTIGTIIAAKVAFDIASARIGDVVKNGITGMLSGSTPSGTGGTVSSGSRAEATKRGGNIGGAVLNGLSIAAVTGMAIYANGVTTFEASQVNIGKSFARLNEARAQDLTTKEGRARVKELYSEQQDATFKTSEASLTEKLIGWLTTNVMASDQAKDKRGKAISADLGFRDIADEGSNVANESKLRELVIKSKAEEGKALQDAAKEISSAASAFRAGVKDMPTGAANGEGATAPTAGLSRPEQPT